MNLGERVSSLETIAEHTKETVDRIEKTQNGFMADMYAKINHVSSQVASLTTTISSDKAAEAAEEETDIKWKNRIAVVGGGIVSGISVALTDHFDLLSKLFNLFKQ